MKNKLDWFDDNWNWDVRPTRVLYELLLSPYLPVALESERLAFETFILLHCNTLCKIPRLIDVKFLCHGGAVVISLVIITSFYQSDKKPFKATAATTVGNARNHINQY